MKRVIFLNRFFYPDHSATSQIVSDPAFLFGRVGHGCPRHPVGSSTIRHAPRWQKEEAVKGLAAQVHLPT